MKFKNKLINIIQNPIFIIGINPGKQRKMEQTNIVWEGNKSSDLLLNIIQNINNLFLTNLYNYQNKNISLYINKGLQELNNNIQKYKPFKIICLGNIVSNYILKFTY